MDVSVIEHVKAQGFRVFLHDGSAAHGWLMYTDGTRLASLAECRFGDYRVSTKHRPNQTTGTGFLMCEEFTAQEITPEVLALGFAQAPPWANDKQRASVRKYGDLTAFLTSDKWNARYVEV